MTQSNLPPRTRSERLPSDSSTPLALAYAAFRRTGPSEFEVNAAVHRLHVRIQGTRQQPARRQRVRRGSLLACAAIFIGAAAYAAGSLGGSVLMSGAVTSSAPTTSAPTSSNAQAASTRAQSRENHVQLKLASTEPRASSAPGAELARGGRDDAAPPRSTSSRAQSRSSTKPALAPQVVGEGDHRRAGAADWGVVAEAMASNDYVRAERALAELARSDAPETRLNAKLGQAQLAAGRGDCAEARRLATTVLESAPSAQTRRRTEQVLTRCAPESGTALR